MNRLKSKSDERRPTAITTAERMPYCIRKLRGGHAANAVIKYGLPKIQPSTDDTTECINAMGVFAQDLATWLQSFARGLNEYRNTDDYARARESSRRAMAD